MAYSDLLDVMKKFSKKEYAEAVELFDRTPGEAMETFSDNKKIREFLTKLGEIKGKFDIDFSSYPFGVPGTLTKYKEITDILSTSFYVQSITCTSNACSKISMIINRCLNSIGVPNRIVYGILNVKCKLKIPHVWINICKFTVDNTFVVASPDFKMLRKRSEYLETDPENEDDIFLGDEYTQERGITNHNIKLFRWDIENQNKALAMITNVVHLQRYYTLMKEFMFNKYNVRIEEESSNVDKACWTCMADSPEKLKTCVECKIARYCSRKCQKKDWKKIHQLICIPSMSF